MKSPKIYMIEMQGTIQKYLPDTNMIVQEVRVKMPSNLFICLFTRL